MTWRHDGSFSGFLSAVFGIWQEADHAARLRGPASQAPEQADLFGGGPAAAATEGERVVGAQAELAKRVWQGLRARGGAEASHWLRDAFLHAEPGGDQALLDFVRLVMRHGPGALERLSEAPVRETERRCRAVRREAHRFCGFLRFQELALPETLYYARFRPDHRILALLVPHFRDRMANQDWMIHDEGRSEAAWFRDGAISYLEGVQVESLPPASAGEAAFHEAWKAYFGAIAIPERRNPGLQRALMPKKYWEFLVEEPG